MTEKGKEKKVGNKLDVTELTRDLIAFDTIAPPGNEQSCAKYIGRLLFDAGFRIRYHEFAPGRTGLVARIGGNDREKPLCLAGHIDTVPLGGEPWSVDPFAGAVSGGKIYGRGSSDMKGGIAAMVVAAVGLADRLKETAGLSLVFVAGEETGCVGSAFLAETPEELGEAGALIVGEPTGNYPMLGHKGAFWIDAVVRGKTAHGSMPELGVNAIYRAARAVQRLAGFDFGVPTHPQIGAPTLNVGTISGGININSVPDKVKFAIDIRTIPGLDHGALMTRLAAVMGEDVELRPRVDVEGIWTDPSDPWMAGVFGILTEVLGERPEARAISYFTDAGLLTPALGGVPTIIMGPGEAEMAHKIDEYCRIDRLEQAVEVYSKICAAWCGV